MMAKPKKAVVVRTPHTGWTSSVVCPHCNAELIGHGINSNVLRISCWQCKKPIDLIHGSKEEQ